MFRDLLFLGLTLAKLKWYFSIFYENHPFPSPPLYGSVLWTNIKKKKQRWFYSRQYINIFQVTNIWEGTAFLLRRIVHTLLAVPPQNQYGTLRTQKQYIQHSYVNPASYAGHIFCSSASSLTFLLCMFSVIKSDFIGFVCARWVTFALVIQLSHAHRLTQANCLSKFCIIGSFVCADI